MKKENTTDKEFLSFIINSIVDDTDGVRIDRSVDEMGVLLSVHVKTDDMRKVIGKQGSIIEAIRKLVRSVGMKNGSHVNVRIEEPDGK